MGASFTDELFWSLEADAAPPPDDVALNLRRLGSLSRIQLKQTTRPKIDAAVVRMIKERVLPVRPDIRLRVFGGARLDLSFLESLPHLQRLRIEVHERLDNVTALTGLKGLTELDLSLPISVESNLLTHLPSTLKSLALRPDAGKASRLELEPLLQMKALTSLEIEAYELKLGVILPGLESLQRLSLRSIKNLSSLSAVAGLARLQSVRMLLCSTHNLDALLELPKLRHLVLWRLAKLGGVELISKLQALEALSLETLPSVKAFPVAKHLGELRVVKLAAMKNMRDFSALRHAPALEEFVFQSADQQRPEDFVPVLRNSHLRRGGFGFQKRGDVREMTELLAKHRIDGEVFKYPQVRGDYPGFTSDA